MEKFERDHEAQEYIEPQIEDYGTLEELTASGGSHVQDVPIGTPVTVIGPAVVGSTP